MQISRESLSRLDGNELLAAVRHGLAGYTYLETVLSALKAQMHDGETFTELPPEDYAALLQIPLGPAIKLRKWIQSIPNQIFAESPSNSMVRSASTLSSAQKHCDSSFTPSSPVIKRMRESSSEKADAEQKFNRFNSPKSKFRSYSPKIKINAPHNLSKPTSMTLEPGNISTHATLNDTGFHVKSIFSGMKDARHLLKNLQLNAFSSEMYQVIKSLEFILCDHTVQNSFFPDQILLVRSNHEEVFHIVSVLEKSSSTDEAVRVKWPKIRRNQRQTESLLGSNCHLVPTDCVIGFVARLPNEDEFDPLKAIVASICESFDPVRIE